ncbi:hypothetical protein NPIL_7621 [Nephila pilipes]|uniref:Uncharacterized protein n=1 Tax=Nephila pilipes TaxID=299642 RepID=A0A8X6P910_NEPPI|nr:hypothetical protein NPIL_7621 [Nephila pilipes]
MPSLQHDSVTKVFIIKVKKASCSNPDMTRKVSRDDTAAAIGFGQTWGGSKRSFLTAEVTPCQTSGRCNGQKSKVGRLPTGEGECGERLATARGSETLASGVAMTFMEWLELAVARVISTFASHDTSH